MSRARSHSAGAGPPARPARFFYGWVIVAVMAATGALTMALGGLNFGLFVKPMGDDLGLGRALFGWTQSVRQIASAVSAPLVGGLIDRLGARLLLAIAATVTGLAMVGLAFAREGWQLIVLFGVMGIVGMSGPGALVTSVPVTRWFVRERGRALAYTSLGIPIGGLLFVPLTQILIDAVGWRAAWIVLAGLGVGVIVPLSLLFIRRQPEDLGLLPDGVRPTEAALDSVGRPSAAPMPSAVEERSWTRAEAVRTATFWRLALVFSMVMLAIGSFGVHRIPNFLDRGLDPLLVSYATALDAAASGLSTFAVGLLSRRYPARLLGAAGFLLLALASALTIVAADHPVMFASMIIFGLGIGTVMLMQNLLWADYFGRRHLGSIRGAVMPLTLILGATGAPVAGYIRDLTGSYAPAWYTATGLMVLGAVVLAVTPAPRARPDQDSGVRIQDSGVTSQAAGGSDSRHAADGRRSP